jgi:hypothetical protein
MSFSVKIDSLIKEFCTSIAQQYKLNEDDLFSIWKGESPKKSQVQKTLPFQNSTLVSTSKRDSSETSESSKEEFEITKEKIMVANKDLLAAMCKKKGLKMSGKKEELVQRLLDSLGPSSSSSSSSTSKSVSTKKDSEPPVIKNVKENSGEFSVRPNKFGNFEHVNSGLVFSRDKIVIGKQSSSGEILPLTVEDIETCKKYKFNYKLPENLNVNKSLDDVNIEEVEEDEELDEEDIEEEEELEEEEEVNGDE